MIPTLVLAVALLLLTTAPSPVAAQGTESPHMGGVLKAAMIGEPPSLDLHWTTAVITQQISWHVFETLYQVLAALPDGTPGFAAAAQLIGRMARLCYDELG